MQIAAAVASCRYCLVSSCIGVQVPGWCYCCVILYVSSTHSQSCMDSPMSSVYNITIGKVL
jgi:hypothetical protein